MNNYFIIKINKENNENFDPNLQVPKECINEKKLGVVMMEQNHIINNWFLFLYPTNMCAVF